MKQNIELSRKYERKITAKLGACFENAQRLTLKLKDPNALYVEGFTSSSAGQHGWVELDGEIIDITPGWIGKTAYFSGEGAEYFPGPKYTYQEVEEKGVTNLPLWFRVKRADAVGAWKKAQADCMEYLGLSIEQEGGTK